MRKLIIKTVVQNTITFPHLIGQCHLNYKSSEVSKFNDYMYELYDTYQINPKAKINKAKLEELLNTLPNEELLNVFDNQLCDKYR